MKLEDKINEIMSRESTDLTTDDILVVKEVVEQVDQGKLRVAYYLKDKDIWVTRLYMSL